MLERKKNEDYRRREYLTIEEVKVLLRQGILLVADNTVTFNLWIVCKYKKGKRGTSRNRILRLCCQQSSHQFILHPSRL